MNSLKRVALIAATLSLALTACGGSDADAPQDESSPSESAASVAPEGPQESSTIDELEAQLPKLDDLEVSDLGNHIEVSFTGSEVGDSLEHKATLDIVQAVGKYTGDYDYLMVVGNEPSGTWAYSYDHDTVDEIGALDDPVVSKIWDAADRAVDPR